MIRDVDFAVSDHATTSLDREVGQTWAMVLLSPALPIVQYGKSALCDVLPSVLAALGLRDEPNTLELSETPRVAVLLVDGLG